MKAFRPALVRCCAVAFLAANPSSAILAQSRTAPSVLDVPPPIIDPIAGPFIVSFDLDGKLTGDADGIIANAASSWMLGKQDTYIICFQPGADKKAWRSGFLALKNVASQLKEHGAGGVVSMPGGKCPPDFSAQRASPPYVYIMGAIRL